MKPNVDCQVKFELQQLRLLQFCVAFGPLALECVIGRLLGPASFGKLFGKRTEFRINFTSKLAIIVVKNDLRCLLQEDK